MTIKQPHQQEQFPWKAVLIGTLASSFIYGSVHVLTNAIENESFRGVVEMDIGSDDFRGRIRVDKTGMPQDVPEIQNTPSTEQ